MSFTSIFRCDAQILVRKIPVMLWMEWRQYSSRLTWVDLWSNQWRVQVRNLEALVSFELWCVAWSGCPLALDVENPCLLDLRLWYCPKQICCFLCVYSSTFDKNTSSFRQLLVWAIESACTDQMEHHYIQSRKTDLYRQDRHPVHGYIDYTVTCWPETAFDKLATLDRKCAWWALVNEKSLPKCKSSFSIFLKKIK